MPVARNIFDVYKNEPALQEAVRTLRTNIQFSSVDKPIKTIVLTSVAPGEGKTSIAIALGISMAEAGKKTLLIEMDCRRPMLGNRLKIRPKFNWINVLYNDMPISEAAVPTIVKNLFFMDVEMQMTHLAEVISSNKFNFMLSKLSNEYDTILFDTPPLGMFIEAAVLANRTDGTLLVIKPGMNDTQEELDVIAQLEKANARILGVILNGVQYSSNKNGYYHYYKGEKKHSVQKRKKFNREGKRSVQKKKKFNR